MKYVLLALATLTLLSCDKDQKFLTSGTWTIEKIVVKSDGRTITDGQTKVEFMDNGKYTISGVPGEVEYLITDGRFYKGSAPGSGYSYTIKRKSMTIEGSIYPYSDPLIPENSTTYLVK